MKLTLHMIYLAKGWDHPGRWLHAHSRENSGQRSKPGPFRWAPIATSSARP